MKGFDTQRKCSKKKTIDSPHIQLCPWAFKSSRLLVMLFKNAQKTGRLENMPNYDLAKNKYIKKYIYNQGVKKFWFLWNRFLLTLRKLCEKDGENTPRFPTVLMRGMCHRRKDGDSAGFLFFGGGGCCNKGTDDIYSISALYIVFKWSAEMVSRWFMVVLRSL